ncbi:FecR domain-containing protein [Luteolibacter marinus]|uniref:FecR domain-containing protein n=1 Tax=Luteolibacter marinus TaxID=2776705 RepID=UPI0018691540|nr:FecR domain-containing protein [Luteolibacter marinus]
MDPRPSPREVQSLIEGFEDQTLSEAEHDRFVRLLEQSAEVRKLYLEHIRLSGFLRHEAHNRRILGKLSSLSDRKDGSSRRRIVLSGLAAAACLMALAVTAAFIRVRGGMKVTFRTSPGTVWSAVHSSDGPRRDPDDVLGEKSRLTVDQGTVDLALPRDVSCLLSGPAELEIVDKSTVRLVRGAAWFRVGHDGRGFTVEAPSFTAVDLGTEFGVRIPGPESGDAESLHVEVGRVNASLQGQSATLELRAGDGVKVVDGAWVRVPAAGDSFQKSLPSTLPYLHWTFDEPGGDTFASTGSLPRADRYPAVMNHLREPVDVAKNHAPGRFGGALALHAAGDWAETTWPGISGNAPRSVALWIKIPAPDQAVWSGQRKNVPRRNVVSWGDWASPGEAWSLDFPMLESGDYGFFTRWAPHDGGVFTPTQVLDGTWHHLASVYTGKTRDDGTAEIVHYVDGVAHHAHYWRDRARSPEPVSTRSHGPDSQPLRFGLTALVPESDLPTLLGVIDEAYVFAGALSEEQVQLLYQENRVAGGRD